MRAQPKVGYPTKAEIARAVEAAKAAGLTIGGIEVSRDGTIKLNSPGPAAASLESPYDQWKNGR